MVRDRSGATQGRPRSHADGPRQAQRGSRQPHEAPRSLQRRPDTPGSDFEVILGRFWGPQDLEKPQEVLYCQRFSWFSRFRKGAFNRGPKSSKRSSPGGPNEPQARPREHPGAAQEPPRRLQEPPGARQEAPKTTQDRPRRGSKGPKPPRRLQGALREPILASSWGPRGLIFELSRRPFRAS